MQAFQEKSPLTPVEDINKKWVCQNLGKISISRKANKMSEHSRNVKVKSIGNQGESTLK